MRSFVLFKAVIRDIKKVEIHVYEMLWMVDGVHGVPEAGLCVIRLQGHKVEQIREHVQIHHRKMDDHTVVGVLPK